MSQRTKFFPLRGGLDLISPAIEVNAGRAIGGVNYEPLERGYGRILGYERIDGRTKASDAVYGVLPYTDGSAVITAGQTVTGGTSGATGKALIDAIVDSGTTGGGDAAGRLILTEISGTFVDEEDLEVSASPVAVAAGECAIGGAAEQDDHLEWQLEASDQARALIEAVPGSGAIRGVFDFDGVRWAVRDNEGGTAGILYKSSAAGWVQEPSAFGNELFFDAGTAAFEEGETVTGGTSGATASVRRVIVTDGAWGDSDAEGRLILGAITGTFQDDETITSAGGSATVAGTASAITLPAGGRYDFRAYNFTGLANQRAMYFVNGVGRAFEYRDGVLTPLRTGLSDALDKPTHLETHRNHLFLAFAGGSLQHSGIGDPYSWSVVQGAGEIALGESVTGLLSVVDGVLVIAGATRLAVLYGSSSANWDLRTLSDDSGAAAYSLQRIGDPIYLDDRGVRTLPAAEAFGNFVRGTATRSIEPLMRSLLRGGRTPAATVRIRAKDQYRIIWDNGTGLAIYFGRDEAECMPLDFGDLRVSCACSTKDGENREIVIVGGTDGFVYEMESGDSFDGEAIVAFLRLPFNHLGSPTQLKRWHKTTLEVDAPPVADLRLVTEIDYGSPYQPGGIEHQFTVNGGGAFWSESAWSSFWWSTQVEGLAIAWIDRLSTNLSLCIFSGENGVEAPHTIHGLTLHFTYRGLKR